MRRFCVIPAFLSFALSFSAFGDALAGGYHPPCKRVDHPTTIDDDKKCVRVTETVAGDVVNDATVGRDDNDRAGFFIGGDGLITGKLVNNGTIKGGGDVFGALTLGKDADVQGGIFNNGTIVSQGGNAVQLGYREGGDWSYPRRAALIGNIVNAGLIDGHDNGVAALYGTMAGALVNEASGTIRGGDFGVFVADSFWSWSGGIENFGAIEGYEAAIRIGGASFGGGILNGGSIEGTKDGILIVSDAFAGGLLNDTAGTIAGLDGDGVSAQTSWFGKFENRGSISGSGSGFVFAGSSFEGDIDNSGAIEGGDTGLSLISDIFDGAFANSGEIEGGTDGVSLAVGAASGGFTNDGSIKGLAGTGVRIDAGVWGSAEDRADIVNTADGTIEGDETGLWLSALAIFGDVVNDGEILGGGPDTGLLIEAGEFFGDILNSGAIEAPSNAMVLAISALDGAVKNTGTITATDANGIAVALDIGNGATFTNEEDGLIFGDVILGGAASYTFLGRDGGIEGDIVGNDAASLALAVSDDALIVEDGTQYFVLGELANLLSFDVNDGGTAVMGARFVGDPDGPGYGSSNVDALNVNAGGRLYLDDDTILNVGTFSQDADGELTYFLVAPAGAPVAGSDYGRIVASGAVTLGGTLSVILDPASFGGTTENNFTYTDIIQGASFDGEFDTTNIIGSSYFFELALTYGDTSLNLNVTRTPFDVVFCAEHLSANSEDLGAALEAAFLAGGFTPEQIDLFNFLGALEDVCQAYFDLGGAVLGDLNAITSETAGPWKSAVNDRLNSTGATSCVVAGAGGCLTRYAQNDIGASQVMSDASDPFAWLRTGVRPEGQMSVWGRILGVQGDNRGRGGATGSDFTVTGVIGGADYVFSQRFIAGVAAQWTTTDVDFKLRRDTADVQSFEIGGYFSYGDVDFCVSGNMSVIFHEFDTYRFPFGQFAQGIYSGTTISAYAEAGKVFEIDLLRVEPILALSLAALETDPYREIGSAGGNLLIVDGGEHTSFRSFLGVRVAYPLALLESGRKIVPELRAMWGHEFADNQSVFRAALSSLPNNRFTVRGQEFARDSAVVGAGLNVPVSAQAAIYVDYDLFWSRDQTIQSVSLGARVSW